MEVSSTPKVQARRSDCAARAMDETAIRWLDAFSHRKRITTPNLDLLDHCPEEALAVARIVWHRRVVNETRSVAIAQALQQLANRVETLGPHLVEAFKRLEEDEATHVELASAVLNRIGLSNIAIPADTTTLVFPKEPAVASLMRLVLTGLCICESVSASRFACVREHTDLAAFRACIELFYRDELTHAELGFVIAPHVAKVLHSELGKERASAFIQDELRSTFGEMDRVVGLNLERSGGVPPERPQPTPNPGVVEPALDARSFYQSIHHDIVPRLEALGFPANEAWKTRA